MLSAFPYGFVKHFNGKDVDESFHVPNGTAESPYFDAGQGCVIQLFEYMNYIYVMHGSETVAESYYKVARDCYYNAWTNILDELMSK